MLAWATALFALSILAAFFEPLRTWTLLADAALAMFVAFDFAHTPRPSRLDAKRRLPSHAGLSQDFARSVRIDVTGLPAAAGLELELHEEFSPAFEVRARTVRSPYSSSVPIRAAATSAQNRMGTQSTASAAGAASRASARASLDPSLQAPLADDPSGGPDITLLPAAGPIDLVRIYRASRRGVHALSDMRLSLRGPLGLIQRQSRMRGHQPIHIEPALMNLKRTLQLAASERWRDLGVRHLRRRGGMTEFESLRDHVTGDDVRLVDWKAFAKRGRPIVREFQEERGQEMILVFDCGRRMAATTAENPQTSEPANARTKRPVRGWTKLDHALDAGLEIAAVALQQGDRVGCLAFDDKVRAWIPTARSATHLDRLREAVFALQPSTHESNLDRALRELALLHRRRALVLILSDVADPLSVDRQKAALATASRRHKILFASLDDPSLRAAAEGRLSVEAGVRAAAFQLVEERTKSLRQLGGTGVRVLDTLPAEAAAPLLAAWLHARRGAAAW